jgi:transcriptional regulator with XRE-family HTH domain
VLGRRFAGVRLQRNWTQARLAEEAGVSVATVHRLEAGHSVQLSNWLRVLATLGLDGGLDTLVPRPEDEPLAQLERARKAAKGRRRRASGVGVREAPPTTGWTWGEDR